MKSFRFPLESVLEARRAQENDAKQQLAAAMAKQHEAMLRSQEAVQALGQLLQTIAAASAGRFSVADRERFWSLRDTQEKLCAQLRLAVQECAKVTEQKRAALLLARRNCELLEKLKSSRRVAWDKEAVRVEQLQLDEFAMTRRFQAAQSESAVC